MVVISLPLFVTELTGNTIYSMVENSQRHVSPRKGGAIAPPPLDPLLRGILLPFCWPRIMLWRERNRFMPK